MKVRLLAVARQNDAVLEVLINNYVKRIQHYVSFETIVVKPTKSATDMAQKNSDGEQILRRITNDDYLVLLDERGKSFSSVSFANWIASKQQSSLKSISFVIGGAFGFSASLYERASMQLTLSSFTLPHELARLIFLEQLYRSFTILKNQKYHH